MNNDPVTIGKGECIVEREKAILVTMEDRDNNQVDRWIPISCLHANSEVYGLGHTGEVVVLAWWAEEKLGVVARRDAGSIRRPLPLKPPTKKWLKDQNARIELRKRQNGGSR
jgi:hypothetical protein